MPIFKGINLKKKIIEALQNKNDNIHNNEVQDIR